MQEYITFFSDHPLLTMACVALLILLIYSYGKYWLSPVKEVSCQQLSFMINKEDGVVLDVRNHDQFGKGHIPGAFNATVAQVKEKNLAQIEKHQNNPIIVVCDDGLQSRDAGKMLLQQGFDKVFCLKGGIAEWRQENLPLSKKR